MSPPTIDNSQVSGWGGIRFAAGNMVANMDMVDISCCSPGNSYPTLSDDFQQVKWCHNHLSAINVHLLMGLAEFPSHPFGVFCPTCLISAFGEQITLDVLFVS